MEAVAPYLPQFWAGFLVTAQVTALSALLALPLGLLLALARRSEIKVVRWGTGAVVEFFRGTSVIVQLFWVFYGLPLIFEGVEFSPLQVAVAVLALNAGAYASEVARGALDAVPRGQLDAASALSLQPSRRLRAVVLPQALPLMLPPLASITIDIMKASALVSFVTVSDLTFWVEQTRAATGETATVYLIALPMYFGLALVISAIFRGLEALLPVNRITRTVDRQLRRPLLLPPVPGIDARTRT